MKKGFTLIELLSVIVILAIILVIAVPQIFKVIEGSRKEAFVSSTKNLMSALEKTSINMIRGNEYKDIFVMYENSIKTVYPSNANVDYKGTNPVAGGIIYGKEGNIILSLYNGKYCVSKTKDNEEIVIEEITEIECVNKIMYKQASIPFNNLVTNGNFSNGVTGWTSSQSTLSVTNDRLRIQRISGAIAVSQNYNFVANRKYYVRLTGISTDMLDIYVYISNWTRIDDKNYSVIHTPTADATYFDLGRVVYTNGTFLEIDSVLIIDLTSSGLTHLTVGELNTLTTTANWFDSVESAITPKVRTVAKNLFDKSDLEQGGFNSGGVSVPTGLRVRDKNFRRVVAGSQCTASATATVGGSLLQLSLVNYYDVNFNFISQVVYDNQSLPRILTIPANAVYNKNSYRIASDAAVTPEMFSAVDLQLEIGVVTTTYEIYNGTYYFEVTPFNKLWFDTTTNTPKKFSAGSWIGL